MFSKEERRILENQLIAGMFLSEQFFLKIYDFNPNKEDLFCIDENREIYLTALNHFVERGYPTVPGVFNELIMKNADQSIKDYFCSGPATCEASTDFKIMLRLIEDSIEQKARKVIESINKQNLIGIEYTERIREGLDKVLLEKFNCYQKDNRNNQEKVNELLKGIQHIRSGDNSDYLPTGLKRLDAAIIGLPKSHITVIAGRPGMGKTSFMLQLKRNLIESGHKPLIISLEMTSDQLLIKDLSAYTGIDSMKIESGQINDEENIQITHAARKIYEDNYVIEDDGFWNIEKINATIRRHLIKEQIDCVFIDYLTLIKTESRKDRYDLAVGEITNSLRQFAKETKLPIVLLSQLNRDSERRIDKKPILADLRESGSIEQDSKTVLFLYRPEAYNIVSDNLNNCTTEDYDSVKNDEYAEIIIAKCRNGKTGIVPVRYRKEIHLFENLIKNQNGYNNSSRTTSIKSLYEG